MADVRSMLRAERAARRITHPHASYTTGGKLLCNLCETQVKSEAQWQSHLHSTQHTLRSQRAQEAKAARASSGNNGSKKRKAENLDVDSPVAVEKKRARSGADELEEDVAAGPLPKVDDDVQDAEPEIPASADAVPNAVDADAPADADELAAFERDLAALEAESRMAPIPSALDSGATITAAPMTAEQLAAQAREEASAQRGKRDRELEEEREDAARMLEEEFDEMEGLEERVRKLRERREALRRESSAANDASPAGLLEENGVEDEQGSDEDDEDEDEWRFGSS